MGIKVRVSGSFKEFNAFAGRMQRHEHFKAVAKYGPIGVQRLKEATEKDSQETANSWEYEVINKPGYFAIHWYNTHMVNGVPVVILLQYGHGTRGGGYVEGVDFINPAMRPIFQQMADEMWKVVTR